MSKTFILLLLVYTLPTALLGFFLIKGPEFFLFFPCLLLFTLPLAYKSMRLKEEKPWRAYIF